MQRIACGEFTSHLIAAKYCALIWRRHVFACARNRAIRGYSVDLRAFSLQVETAQLHGMTLRGAHTPGRKSAEEGLRAKLPQQPRCSRKK